jgi:RNA polymerase sigma factor for flagellar operon FliA
MPPLPWTAQFSEKQAEPVPMAAVLLISSENDTAAAREQILLEHMPVVRFVARRIHDRLPQHVELEDLVSAGVVGLIDAFSKFDRTKKVQFRSYAQFRIRGAILDSLRSLDWGSRELRRKGRNIEEAVQTLTQQLNRKPSESEISAELGMALVQYQGLLGELKSLEIGSLNETRSEDSVEEELAFLPTAPEEDPLYRCMKSEMSAHLSAAVAKLPEREARVLALYYIEEMTLKEIGVVLGLVESRVSQIRASAMTGLRAHLTRRRKYPEARPMAGSKVRLNSAHLIPAAVIERSAVSTQQAAQFQAPVR